MPQWWNDLHELTAWTGPTLYLVVFVLIFVECGIPIGFLLPGDTVLFAAGLVSARPESGITTAGIAGVIIVAAILGDLVGYETGRRYGRPWLLRRTEGKTGHGLERAEAFLTRWGALAVISCRFIPWLRTFVPILAGVGRMNYAAFTAANVGGAFIWGGGLVLMGRVAHESETVRYIAYAIAITAITGSVVVAVYGAIRRKRAEAAGS